MSLFCRSYYLIQYFFLPVITLLNVHFQVADNHVINYIDPETWHRTSKVGRKRSQGKFGCLVIGADSRDPQLVCFGVASDHVQLEISSLCLSVHSCVSRAI